MGALRATALEDKRGVRREERGDPKIFYAMPFMVFPARACVRAARGVRERAGRSGGAALFFNGRRAAALRRGVVEAAPEIPLRRRGDECMDRAGGARRRAL